MQKFIDFLKNACNNELPGIDSHSILAPKFKGKSFRNMTPSKDAKESAVMLILEPNSESNDFNIIFTLRSAYLNKHSGQISFPGGRLDMNETPEQAAMRETKEEIGIDESNYKVIAKLSTLYVPPSNNIIYPFVAVLEKKSNYSINPDEVEEIFSVNINNFNLNTAIKFYTDVFDGLEVQIPYFDVHKSTKLWGATSMILAEFLFLYDEFLKLDNYNETT